MKLKPTKAVIGLLCGGLALTLCAAGGVLWLENGMLTQVRDRLRERQVQLEDGQRMASRQEQANVMLQADLQQLRFLETSVSDKAYVPTLLKQLEDLAVRTQNKVVAVRPQGSAKKPTKLQQRRDPEAQAKAKDGEGGEEGEEKKKPEPYTPLDIQVNIVGTFKSTQAFIQELNRFPKILSVEQMELRPKTDTNGPGPSNMLDVQLRVTAFVMKETVPPPVINAEAEFSQTALASAQGVAGAPPVTVTTAPAATPQGGSR